MDRLLVMRHAKSSWATDAGDFDRPLSSRGLEDAPRMGRFITNQGWTPDAVLASAANRAATTARYAASAWNGTIDERPELYGAGVRDVVRVLEGAPGQTVLVVGHNPTLDAFVAWLSADDVPLQDDGKCMTTAAVAAFELDALEAGGGRLAWLQRPRDLAITD